MQQTADHEQRLVNRCPIKALNPISPEPQNQGTANQTFYQPQNVLMTLQNPSLLV